MHCLHDQDFKMKVQTRSKVCKTCPWREENQHQLEIQNVRKIIRDGIISPCHQELEEITGSPYEGVEKYAAEVDVFKVCRGIVVARSKYNIPKVVPIWAKLDSSYKFNDDPPVADLMEVIHGNIGH